MSVTVENKEVSSGKILILDLIPFSRSLLYIKNNNGPRTDPCGTSDSTLAQLDTLFPFIEITCQKI